MSDSPPRTRLAWMIVDVPDVASAIDFHKRAFGPSRRFVADDQRYGEREWAKRDPPASSVTA